MANIETLSPANVMTLDNFVASPAGINGTAVLNNAGKTFIQVYESLGSIVADYDPTTAVYQQAATYFAGNGSLFAVINYGPDAVTGSSASASGAAASSGASSAGSSSSTSASGATGSTSSSSTPSESAQAIAAITKYWTAGWTYIYMLATDSNKQVVLDVASFIEEQNERLTVIDVPTTTDTPDLSWLAPLKETQSAIKLSLKYYTNYQFGMKVLAQLTSNDPSTDPTFLSLDSSVVPQDKYEFTKDKELTYYAKYNVATYAHRGAILGLTDNHTSDATQIGTMTTREWITNSVYAAAFGIFQKNKGKIPYDQNGADLFTNAVKAVLKSATDNEWIDPSYTSVTPVDVSKVTLAKRATGQLSGIAWQWAPVYNIDDVVFQQALELPQE